ncbi:MAG: hypothetical protein A2010_05145 [Nitrospirae bacterium GWD2_57_9]|nr:MAG: hypothetical protein A2010_05145 [Nitrospirae bacterium GWD2_57_9]
MKHFGLSEPRNKTHPHPDPLPEGEGLVDKDTSIGEFPKCTEDGRAWRKEFSPGALLSVTFLALTLIYSVA